WHAQLVAKGEIDCLTEAIQAGGPHRGTLARHLSRRHPDAACAAILALVPQLDDAAPASVSNLLGDIPSHQTLPFLLDELEHVNLNNRLMAAAALTELGRPEGIAALVEQWDRLEMAELKRVGPFLVRSGRPEAVRAVTRRFAEQSIDERAGMMYEAS